MLRVRWGGPAWLVTAVTVGLGCGENVLGPLNNRSFVLAEVGGEPLPATVEVNGSRITFLADTIRLVSGDRWRRSRSWIDRAPSGFEQRLEQRSGGFITLRDGAIVLDSECDDVGVCLPPDVLHQRGTAFVIRRSVEPPDQFLRFVPLGIAFHTAR